MTKETIFLTAQSLQNSSTEILWDGENFLPDTDPESSELIHDADFLYEKGAVWREAASSTIRFHPTGWLLVHMDSLDLDAAGRKAPVTIMVNYRRASKEDLERFWLGISKATGRSFSETVTSESYAMVLDVMTRAKGFGVVEVYARFLFQKVVQWLISRNTSQK